MRQKDLIDNATPSANSTAALALLRLAALTGEQRYSNHAEQILRLLATMIPKAPSAFSNALAALDLQVNGITEVAVVGDRPDLVAVVRERWRPSVVLAWGQPFDSPLWEHRTDGNAYVCESFTCQQPAADITLLRSQLDELRPTEQEHIT